MKTISISRAILSSTTDNNLYILTMTISEPKKDFLRQQL